MKTNLLNLPQPILNKRILKIKQHQASLLLLRYQVKYYSDDRQAILYVDDPGINQHNYYNEPHFTKLTQAVREIEAYVDIKSVIKFKELTLHDLDLLKED